LTWINQMPKTLASEAVIGRSWKKCKIFTRSWPTHQRLRGKRMNELELGFPNEGSPARVQLCLRISNAAVGGPLSLAM